METKRWTRMLLRTAMASTVAGSICLATDEPGRSGASSTDSSRSGETRSSDAASKTQDTLATFEGKLVSLHDYMMSGGSSSTATGSSSTSTTRSGAASGRSGASSGTATDRDRTGAGATAGLGGHHGGLSASGMHGTMALETAGGLIILSDPQAMIGAAGASAGRLSSSASTRSAVGASGSSTSSTNRSDTTAGVDRSTSKLGTADRAGEGRLGASGAGADAGIFGIPREDLDKAEQRVRVTGTLYTKGGIRYLMVSSANPAGSGGASGDINRSDAGRSGSDTNSRRANDQSPGATPKAGESNEK